MTDKPAVLALQFAVEAFAPEGGLPLERCDDLIRATRKLAQLLTGPISMYLSVSPQTFDQADPDGPGVPTVMKGTIVQLTDRQGVILTPSEVDSEGQAVTGDNFTYTVDDPTVITLTPSADGSSVTAAATLFTDQVNGKLGSATVTGTDSTVDPPIVATFAFNVVASAPVSATLNAGEPFDLASPPA